MSENLDLIVKEHAKIAGTITREQEPMKLAAEKLQAALTYLKKEPTYLRTHVDTARTLMAEAGALVLVEKDHCIAIDLSCDDANRLRNKILSAMEGLPS